GSRGMTSIPARHERDPGSSINAENRQGKLTRKLTGVQSARCRNGCHRSSEPSAGATFEAEAIPRKKHDPTLGSVGAGLLGGGGTGHNRPAKSIPGTERQQWGHTNESSGH